MASNSCHISAISPMWTELHRYEMATWSELMQCVCVVHHFFVRLSRLETCARCTGRDVRTCTLTCVCVCVMWMHAIHKTAQSTYTHTHTPFGVRMHFGVHAWWWKPPVCVFVCARGAAPTQLAIANPSVVSSIIVIIIIIITAAHNTINTSKNI